jgi:hypothetical protein
MGRNRVKTPVRDAPSRRVSLGIVAALMMAPSPAAADDGAGRADRTDRGDATGDEVELGEALAQYVASRAHDRALRREVRRWHGTLTNGCVAYASTALRHVGVEIDERGKLDGDGSRGSPAASRVTSRSIWAGSGSPTPAHCAPATSSSPPTRRAAPATRRTS